MRLILFLLPAILVACNAAPPMSDSVYSGPTVGDGRSGPIERQGSSSSEELSPYAAPMIYPENWAEITRKRQGQ